MFTDKKKLIKQTCNTWRRENFKLQLYLLQQDSLISVSEKYDKFMFVVRLYKNWNGSFKTSTSSLVSIIEDVICP